MKKRILLPVAALLAAVLMLNGCPRGGGGGAPAPGAGGQAVDVTLKDFAFAMPTNTVNRGKVAFRIKNDGPSVHNFTITGVKGADSQDLSAGATQNLEVTLDKAGTYTVVCTVPGHKEAGMTTNLVVQ